MKHLLTKALSLAVLCAAPAFATTYNFNSPTGTLGHSQSYGPSATSVTAYAFAINSGQVSNANLYGKNSGTTEQGIGISGTLDNEITSSSFVQLDVVNLTSPFTLLIGSDQDEPFRIFVSNTLGSLGSLYAGYTGVGSDPFMTGVINTPDRYVSVIAGNGRPSESNPNVLVDSLSTVASTPEPSSFIMLGTGVLGAAGMVRRKLGL